MRFETTPQVEPQNFGMKHPWLTHEAIAAVILHDEREPYPSVPGDTSDEVKT